jgi:hypothetical protein
VACIKRNSSENPRTEGYEMANKVLDYNDRESMDRYG